jgi:hypothetical protein
MKRVYLQDAGVTDLLFADARPLMAIALVIQHRGDQGYGTP